MLLEFTIKNYKCFKEEAKLSLIASNYDKNTREDDNTFIVEKFGLRLLKSAVIYGANASGKTKLVEALGFMKNFILNSSKEGQIDEPTGMTPFLLSTETENTPSVFEVIFIHNNDMYRYGFEADSNVIHSEWLYHKPKTKETELFYRDTQDFEVNTRKFKVGDLVKNDRIRPNALLLSVAANWNNQLAKNIFDWLKNFNVISGLEDEKYEAFSIMRMQKNKKNKAKAMAFLKNADLGIENIDINTFGLDSLPGDLPDEIKEFLKNAISEDKEDKETKFFSGSTTFRKKYDDNNLLKTLVEFSMEEDESSGTRKYFALSGSILETLKNGEILLIDELANRLHPNLTYKLVELFNSKEKNPNNAQIIFTTHDTNLLSSDLFRRDQIWFTEKDRYGASSVYSLDDFKTNQVRKKDNFEKNYIKGKYGAIPYLGDFEELLTL